MCSFFLPRDRNLYVITTIFNPKRFESRIKLYKEFEKRTLDSGARLIVIEAVFGDNKPQITEEVNKHHHIIHVKACSELWLKENLLNLAFKNLYRLYPRWRYVAWIDADLAFARPDWKKETIRLLKIHPIIQMFSHITHLNHNYQPLNHVFSLSFMEGWNQGLAFKNKKPSGEDPTKVRYGWCGAPGGAWAVTRTCLEFIFPLLDIGIVGSSDFHMANALQGHVEFTLTQSYTKQYINAILAWQQKIKPIWCKVGYMKGLLLHYWHGKIVDRGYETRWKILVRNKYDPETDLLTNSQGVYYINPAKPQLIKDLEEYFKSRNEDSE